MKVILEVKGLGSFDLSEYEPWMKIYEDEIYIRLADLPEELTDEIYKELNSKVHIEWDNPIMPVIDIDGYKVEAGFSLLFEERSEMYFIKITLK